MKRRLTLGILAIMCVFAITSCKKAEEPAKKESTKQEKEQKQSGGMEVAGLRIKEADAGYRFYDVILKNNTGQIVHTVSVNVQYLDDDNNLVDSSYPQVQARVQPGQTIAIEGLIEEGTAAAMTVDQCSYFTLDGNYVEEIFQEIPEALSLREPKEEMFTEAGKVENNAVEGPVKLDGGTTAGLALKEIKCKGEDGSGFVFYDVVVENATDEPVHTVSVLMTYLDENGNITGVTYPQEASVVQPGQSITIGGLVEAGTQAYVTVDSFSYYIGEEDYFEGFFPEIPQAVALGQASSGTPAGTSGTSAVQEAYNAATTLTVDQLSRDSLGGYRFQDMSIVEQDRDWIEDPLNKNGTVEKGALYRTLATGIEGFSFISYNQWRGSIVPVLFGFEKPATKDELAPYIDNAATFIVLEGPLKSVMNRLAALSCVEGTIDTSAGVYQFTITDLQKAAEEMQITEQTLGYILAMVEEYGPTTSFSGNTYTCDLTSVGQ